MPLRQRYATFILILSVDLTPAFADQGASFTPLGDLPGGTYQSTALAVSADGSVIVGHSMSDNGREAFRWSSSQGMRGLGDLPGGTFDSVAYAASSDGSIIVGASNGLRSGVVRDMAFRWTGVMTPLSDVDFSAIAPNSARGVSWDGSIVVGLSDNAYGFRWENGHLTTLPSLPGGGGSGAYGISGNGTIAFGSTGPGTQAARWENDLPTNLGHLGTGGDTWAWGASFDGSVVIGQSDSQGNSLPLAFRWQGGVMTNWGTLPVEGYNSIGRAVSADGLVCIGYYGGDPRGVPAFIADTTCGVRDLTDALTTEYGMNLSGWALRFAYGVSADGTVIVGSGDNPSGSTEAWRVIIPRRSGDLNHDGRTDGRDIRPFVLAVFSSSTLTDDVCRADFDYSGVIDAGDLPGFIDALLHR